MSHLLPKGKQQAPDPKGIIPFPVTIGGSKITTERISGTPSKVFPILRDLGETKEFRVFIEIDLTGGRTRGTISGVSGSTTLSLHGLSRQQEHDPPQDVTEWNCTIWRSIVLKHIIAFRVLAVERL